MTPLEREIVQSATSVDNECAYCVAGHSAFTRFQELDEAPITAIRAGQVIADEILEALRVLTRLLVVKKGKLTDQQIMAFIDAGYRPDQIFEVILGITVKNFSNLASAINKEHPSFNACAEFCERWDQSSFDPDYQNESPEFFVPMVEQVFSRKAYDPQVIRAGVKTGLPPLRP